uniref:HECT domain-containing protein n=1 Tax=Macrostomum lignano TaxID=282301 RepID=A0A1I8IF16_9PLAT
CSTQTPQPFSRPESSTGEGYDAGESCSAEDEDNDDEGRGGGGATLSERARRLATLGRQQLPDCWLVCQFEAAKNTLTFYQHHSDKHVTEDGGLSARCNLCDLMPTVRATVAKLIYRVNQLKLLEEMQTTLRCREMLVPAGTTTSSGRIRSTSSLSVPKPSSNPRRSLPDTSSAPVLLNSAAAATTVSSAVSQNFQAASALDLSSANSSAAAAAAAAAAATIAASEAASVAANTAALLQSPSESRTSGMQLPPHQQSRPPAVTDILSVSVYGLRKPTKLVLECIGSMKTKLDSIVLLKLSDLLSRTPYTKLTAEDINFIQHPLDAAVESFRLRLPSLVKDFTLPFLVYLKQNFNLAFIAPKYRDHACQFRCQWGPGDFGNLGEIYLWNMGFSQGQRYDGIACITCRLLLGNHPMRPTLNSLLVRPQLAFESDDSPADFDSWVAMETVCAPAGSGSSTRSSPAAQASRTAPPPPLHPTLEFKVWKRGGVTVEGLVERVSTCVRHALEDLAMEHRLLTLPFSEVPPEVRKEAADAAAEAAAAACPANKAATGAADDAVAAAATPSERDSPLMSPGGSRRLTASAASRSQQQQLQASIGQSSSSSLSLFTRAIKGGGIQAQATPAATPTPAPPATPSVASVIREFEFGDSGCMNPFYHRVLRPWFARFSKKSSSDQDHQPCQQRSVKLYSAKSIDHFLKHDLPGCLPNLTYAVYEASPGSDPSAAEWTRHSFDTAAAAVDRLPGRKRHFMVLCRSRALWYDALRIAGDPSAAAASAAGPADASASTSANDGASESGSVAGGGVSAPLLKLASFSLTAHGYPSFCPPPGPAALESATSLASVSAAACPHLASIVGGGIETPVSTDSEVSSLNSRPTAPPAKEEAAVCDAAVHTVHRQLFVMICISGKDVTFYSYNLNKQLLDSINERLRNCLAYINQRFLAFKSHVVCPKLGLSHLIPADSMRGPIVNYLHPSAPGGQSASTSAGGVSASSSASAAVVRSRGGQHQLTSAMQLRHRPATQRQHQHHQHQHQLYHPPSASAADAAVGPSGASALVVRDPFTVCRLGLRRANLADLRRESAVASGGSSGSVCDDLYWLFLQLLRLAQMQESRLHHWRKLSALHNDAYGSSATIDLFGSAQLAASGLSPQDLVAALKASLRPVHAVASPIRFDLSRANRPRQARFSLGQQQQPQQQQPQQQQPQHPQMHRETSAPTGGVAGS